MGTVNQLLGRVCLPARRQRTQQFTPKKASLPLRWPGQVGGCPLPGSSLSPACLTPLVNELACLFGGESELIYDLLQQVLWG